MTSLTHIMLAMRRPAFALVLGVASSGLVGQSMDVHLNADTLGVGGQITYSVETRLPKQGRLIGEPRTDFHDFEVLQIKRHESVVRDDRRIEKTDYVLTTFRIDTFVIAPPSVSYVLNNDTLSLRGSSKTIRVVSILDTTAVDIKPEKDLWRARINWWLVGFLVLSILTVIGLIIYYAIRQYRMWRDRKLREATRRPVFVKTPEEIALENLEHLRARRLDEDGYFKEFHIEVSNIIRLFIEQKYRIQALEMPTSELLAECRQARIMEDNFLSLLRRFLELCDLVKFAKHPSSVGECRDLYEDAVNLVKLSIANSAMIRFDDTASFRRAIRQDHA